MVIGFTGVSRPLFAFRTAADIKEFRGAGLVAWPEGKAGFVLGPHRLVQCRAAVSRRPPPDVGGEPLIEPEVAPSPQETLSPNHWCASSWTMVSRASDRRLKDVAAVDRSRLRLDRRHEKAAHGRCRRCPMGSAPGLPPATQVPRGPGHRLPGCIGPVRGSREETAWCTGARGRCRGTSWYRPMPRKVR